VCVAGRLATQLQLTKIPLPPFETIKSKHGQAMFAKQDEEVLLIVKSERADLCYEISKEFLIVAGSDLVDAKRTMMFGYMGGRDLTGFIDGTRNFGAGLGGINLVALIQKGTLERNINNVVEPEKKKAIADAFADDDVGASFVFHGRFKHDLHSFRQLSPAQRSEVVGRDVTRIEVCEMAYARGRRENPMLDSEPDHSHLQRSAGAMARQAWPVGIACGRCASV
jgi:deferrochelatase/peroxidase EfeB